VWFGDRDPGLNKVLTPESRSMMESMKIGWKPAFPYMLHEGSLPGYRSIVVFNPLANVGWVILMNVQDVDFNAINGQLAELMGALFRKKDTDLRKYEGRYTLPGGYGSLTISLKNDSLYSSYLQDEFDNYALVPQGENKFNGYGRSGYAVDYEFVKSSQKEPEITAVRMGQVLWYKE
jgi:hypothetical protein